MGLLDSHAGSRDPSGNWATEPGLIPSIDLEPASLLGVKLGEPVEKLFRLGPTEDKDAARAGELRYYSRGLMVAVEKGKVDGLFVVFSDGLEGYAAFRGTITFEGEPIDLSGASDVQSVMEMFGEPERRDDDEDETVLYFREEGAAWEFEFSPLGLLRCMTVKRDE
jgi:hypothetical protein